jgi:hypothetical protein
MSAETETQTGPSATGGVRQEPQALVRESAKYRRRAQEAERRAEALEAELEEVRRQRDAADTRETEELGSARREVEDLQARLAAVERDRKMEQAFLAAGCVDVEAALALAHRRLDGQDMPEDLRVFARSLLEEKPHLRGENAGAGAGAGRGLPPRTAGAKPAGADAPRRAAERLADEARRTGNAKDVMAYMRARRSGRSGI